jgi:pteridine reductase
MHGTGANLMIHYRSSSREARALQDDLNAVRPDSVALIQADLLDVAVLPSLVTQTVSTFGGLDALVNNASSFYPTSVGSITEKDWVDLMGTNLKAPMFLSQAAASELKRRQGCIVNITDIHADRPMKNYLVYSVAKAGLVGLTKSLARELAPEVRVNGVAPGPILWPEDNSHFDEVSRQRIVSHTMLKRAGEPSDIAHAVRFFIEDAPFVSGQTLAVDGGRSAKL